MWTLSTGPERRISVAAVVPERERVPHGASQRLPRRSGELHLVDAQEAPERTRTLREPVKRRGVHVLRPAEPGLHERTAGRR